MRNNVKIINKETTLTVSDLERGELFKFSKGNGMVYIKVQTPSRNDMVVSLESGEAYINLADIGFSHTSTIERVSKIEISRP